jgi:LacI family transcriptional regulator
MCANDMIAVGLIDAAREAGLSLPKDLAVIGFDDIDTASLITPHLTTVVNPAREVGAACAGALLRRIALGPDEAYTVNALPTHLVRRDSA